MQIDGETMETVTDFIFLGSKITEDGDCSHEIKRYLLLGRKVITNLDSILRSRDISLPTKVCLVKAMVVPVVCMDVIIGLYRKLSAKELMLLNCVVQKILASPLDSKEIKPVNPKGNQVGIFTGRTDAEAEAPILWTPDMKN